MSFALQLDEGKEHEGREFTFNDREFTFLADFVNKQVGIVLSEQKKDMVYSRLVRRLRTLNLTSFSEYCALLKSEEGKGEIVNLVNAITTNLTKFFREEHHFTHLESIISELEVSNPKNKKLRIWSAACSSGMEAYSIAMVVRRAINNISSWDARILATDIDTNMLAMARNGKYPLEQLDNIPAGYRDNINIDDYSHDVVMADELKSIIAFKQLNLLEFWPMSGLFDAVFCRNVVIYFDKETQKKLFERMAGLIKVGGWLYIGHSESLHNISDRFELIGRTIYRKKR